MPLRRGEASENTCPSSVPKEVVLQVLEAAGWAPSAHNSQPWRFIVLEDASVKRRLADAMADAWAKDLQRDGVTVEADKRTERVERFATAPVLILACLTMDGLQKVPRRGKADVRAGLGGAEFRCSAAKPAFSGACEGFGCLLVLCTRFLQRNCEKSP